MSLHVYVEHLTNINSLTIQASLSTNSTKHTKAAICEDGSTFRIDHNGDSAKVKLPVSLPFTGQQTLNIPKIGAAHLNFRFNVSERSDVRQEISNIIPWTARGLTGETAILCAKCDTVILPRDQVSVWKDLPTEGWAEMMDLWHCHKPNEPDTDGKPSTKGYSAMSKLSINSGTGLVSPTRFVLDPSDVKNSKIHKHDKIWLCCDQCDAFIGSKDEQNNSCRIEKHAIAISTNTALPARRLDRDKWPACTLLTAMDDQGVRKFTVTVPMANKIPVLLWIFAPDTCVASTSALTSEPCRAIKVMWRTMTEREAASTEEALTRDAAGTGSIELSTDQYEHLLACLDSMKELLPKSMLHFQDWKVSLLYKFTQEDT